MHSASQVRDVDAQTVDDLQFIPSAAPEIPHFAHYIPILIHRSSSVLSLPVSHDFLGQPLQLVMLVLQDPRPQGGHLCVKVFPNGVARPALLFYPQAIV